MRNPIFVLALLLFPTIALAQDGRFDQVQIQAEDLGHGIHVLFGAGGNLAISCGEDGVFLIDDQFAPLVPKIRAAIEEIAPASPLRFVLNTHFHGDHTGGNEALAGDGVLVVAHHNVRKRMSADQLSMLSGQTMEAAAEGALPVISFGEDISFHLNGITIEGFHQPRAHTDGDAIVHFRGANIIHMGDIFFQGMYPFIDTQNGGSVSGVIAGCDRALAMASEDTRIIPGHGPVSTKADLKAYRDMLETVRDRILALKAEGKSADEIVAAKPTADFDPAWGEGFLPPDRWVAMLCSGFFGDNR